MSAASIPPQQNDRPISLAEARSVWGAMGELTAETRRLTAAVVDLTSLIRRVWDQGPPLPPQRAQLPSAHDLADELVHHPSFAKQLGGIMQLNWPTAVVVGTFVLGGVALSITHHDLPTWMMAVLGAIAAAATNRIAGGSNAR